jgi:hypothetical protein
MSEEFLERLSRFKPDAGGLDRDALLFATGRASARPNRGWVALAALLANTQMLSVALLWPRPIPPAGRSTIAADVAPVLSTLATLEPQTSEAWANAGLWSARNSRRALEAEDRPTGDVTFIDSGPPLRASGPVPPSLLN